MTDVQITYELKSYQQELKYEIDKLQLQLVSAERKLEKVRLDVLICLIMFSAPLLAAVVLGFLSFGALIPSFLCLLAGLLWIITLPFTSFALIKSILIRWKNMDSPGVVWQKPAVRRIPSKTTQEAESSYIAEQKKLTWVLSKYFLYQEHLLRLLEQAEEGDETLTLEDVRTELAAMPFYEEIKPANPFTSKEAKKASILSVIIIIALCLLFFAFH
ncbi:MAG: hypothetical protein HDQ99_10320 [Lachnospiraceae bacterium]|nr:hypothetical protein [Lachnospiraceae bacterium]